SANVHTASAAKPEFRRGVTDGFAAAKELLRTLDIEMREDEWPVLILHGVMPPFQAEGGSVALPVALETLRLKLELPHPRCVASGVIDPISGRVLPVDASSADDALGKLRAVLEEGSFRRLVAVTKADLGQPELDAVRAQSASLWEIATRVW